MKILILILFFTNSLMAIETPKFKVLDKVDNIEIREYNSMVIAVTKVQQPYNSPLSEGFRRIANYIFGGNDREMEIAMTAPVISRKINENNSHEVFFIMPSEHNIDNLPKPNLKSVMIEERNLSKVAAIKFGGWATDDRVKYFYDTLEMSLKNVGYKTIGDYMVAQYNSPWALPPFRKNEILIKVR